MTEMNWVGQTNLMPQTGKQSNVTPTSVNLAVEDARYVVTHLEPQDVSLC